MTYKEARILFFDQLVQFEDKVNTLFKTMMNDINTTISFDWFFNIPKWTTKISFNERIYSILSNIWFIKSFEVEHCVKLHNIEKQLYRMAVIRNKLAHIAFGSLAIDEEKLLNNGIINLINNLLDELSFLIKKPQLGLPF